MCAQSCAEIYIYKNIIETLVVLDLGIDFHGKGRRGMMGREREREGGGGMIIGFFVLGN